MEQYYIRSTRGEWFLDLQGGSSPPSPLYAHACLTLDLNVTFRDPGDAHAKFGADPSSGLGWLQLQTYIQTDRPLFYILLAMHSLLCTPVNLLDSQPVDWPCSAWPIKSAPISP